jgi:hypothetical protein
VNGGMFQAMITANTGENRKVQNVIKGSCHGGKIVNEKISGKQVNKVDKESLVAYKG